MATLERSDNRTAPPYASEPSVTTSTVGSHWLQLAGTAGLFLLLSHVVYAFLWWGTSHQTLGNDYCVNQPREQLFFMQAVRDGAFPLWVPGELGGVPFAAYLLAGQYWPVTWVMLACDKVFAGEQLTILTHIRLVELSMAGLFTYLLLRRLGLTALPAIVAGVVFIFNCRMLDAFRFASGLDVAVWLPVMIYLGESIVTRPRLLLTVLYSVAQYMLLVSGHMQEAFYCICFANLYVLARLTMSMREHGGNGGGCPPATCWKTGPTGCRWKLLASRLACFGGAQVLGLGLCAVMLLPIVEDALPLWARRTECTATFFAHRHLEWSGVVYNLVYPWLADVHAAFYSSQFAWAAIGTAGVSLLTCRSRASDRLENRSHRDRGMLLFFSCVFVLCILYSFGPLTPVAGLVNGLVPQLKMFRCPGRTMTVGMFAAAAVSAYGISRLMRADTGNRALWRAFLAGYGLFLLSGVALAVALWKCRIGLFGRGVYIPFLGNASKHSPATIQRDPEYMVPMMAGTIIVTALASFVLVLLLGRGRKGRVMLLPALLVVSLVETGIYHRKGTWLVDHPVASAHSEDLKRVDVYDNRNAHPIGVDRYTIPPPPLPDDANAFDASVPGRVASLLAHGGTPAWQIFIQNAPGHEIPRAYLTPSVKLVWGDDLAAIAEMEPYATSVIDVTDPVNGLAGSDAALAELAKAQSRSSPVDARARFKALNKHVEVTEYTFNRASFQVQTPQDALLNISDAYAGGWRATVDGETVPIYRANHTFRAIVLPAGWHRVEFQYDPPSFRIGLIVSLASAGVLVCCVATCLSSVTRRRIVLLVVAAVFVVPAARLTYARIYDLVRTGVAIRGFPAAASTAEDRSPRKSGNTSSGWADKTKHSPSNHPGRAENDAMTHLQTPSEPSLAASPDVERSGSRDHQGHMAKPAIPWPARTGAGEFTALGRPPPPTSPRSEPKRRSKTEGARFAVIGMGYWGPNLVRNFDAVTPDALQICCDIDRSRIESISRRYPGVTVTTDPKDVIADGSVDAVAIATPVDTHYPLAKAALEAGKSVLLEKPMTSSVEQAEELVDLAERKGLVLMVDHTFLFSPAVRKMKEIVDDGILGRLLFVDSVRINLGMFQRDTNVVWDLAPHDLSIVDYLLGRLPKSLSAFGAAHTVRGQENVAYLNLDFGDGLIANFHVNWLSPVKIRHTLVGGSARSLVYNDLDPVEKIKVYDSGISTGEDDPEGRRQMQIEYRMGDIWSPHIAGLEPLHTMLAHFVDCVKHGSRPVTDGEAGLRIVRILDAAQRSIKAQGGRITL